MLIVMSGLPGAGKSSIAQALGRLLPAPVLSVDPVEAAMWRAGIDRGQPTGLAAYVVVEALASDVLALGQTVIVDAVNDAQEARQQWRGLARRRSAALRYIEVTCSDHALHRRRLEGRRRDIDGFTEPTWASVEARRANFGTWCEDRLVLDSTASLTGNVQIAIAHLRAARRDPLPSTSE
ncbi:AAA family ATPase [Streptosporangium sandarakinum]|uniref:Putative kinase n=1 Tax=Streptosporangium sandarakinum TaxID=1260955 RepID=A0A852VCA5_9ACTN|nr:AAA family ATPase [Streptosporangium sandarakinum]NYF44684.1 putative kinase [Streptosporangium sandarakinum]